MRIKRGVRKHAKHQEIIKMAKGYQMSYGTLFRRSKEAVWHAGQYSFNDRRRRRSDMKGKWLGVINAALYNHNLSYSVFRNQLTKSNINLNSKMLAELAIDFPTQFNSLVEQVNK